MRKIPVILLIFCFFGCAGTEKQITGKEVQKEEPVLQENAPPAKEEVMTKETKPDEYDFTGSWQGRLNAGAVNLLMVFNIEKPADGYTATMDSPDQCAFGIGVSEVITEGTNITLISSQVGGRYEGEINDDGQLAGTWFQSGGAYTCILERKAPVEKTMRPQDPVEPYPYTAENITFPDTKAGITLAGTLTIPGGNGPYAAVVMITGSGPQNRNEEIMNHRPFLVIADFLTRNGIAVLRYDDRGIAGSNGDFNSATSADLKSDAAAAVDYLLSRDDLDISSIGLVGHSEGGMIAPVLAAENNKIDFIVMLAGSAFSGEDILYQQTEALLAAQGINETIVKQNVALAARIYQIIKNNPDDEKAADELRVFYKSLGASEQDIEANLIQLLSPWFRYFLIFTPRSSLEKLTIPVFAAGGSLDLQVPADINLAEIENSLKKAGNTNYTVKKYTGLNHLFQPAQTGLVSEYAQIDITFSEEVLKDMKDWILSVAK